MNTYKTLLKNGEGEITEKRSRFIAVAFRVQDEASALELVNCVKKRHFAAKHNVFAYRLKSGQQRYSEDGEPQGTAAAPILELLKSLELTDCLVVVTRYFGGILLGTGGLVRAYTSAAKAAIEDAGEILFTKNLVYCISFEYSLYGKIEGLVSSFGGRIVSSDFADSVSVSAAIPFDSTDAFLKKLTDVTLGAATVEFSEEIYK